MNDGDGDDVDVDGIGDYFDLVSVIFCMWRSPYFILPSRWAAVWLIVRPQCNWKYENLSIVFE